MEKDGWSIRGGKMIVYLVEVCYEDGYTNIVGAFSNEKAAKECRKSSIEDGPYGDGWIGRVPTHNIYTLEVLDEFHKRDKGIANDHPKG
jgi:hypothetical protein